MLSEFGKALALIDDMLSTGVDSLIVWRIADDVENP